MAYQRDPVSELFDRGAREHLRLAYAAGGGWAGRPLAAPTFGHRAWALGRGINLDGDDPAKAAVGVSLNRWDAAFVRAVYYQHQWYWDGGTGFGLRRMVPARRQAIQVEIGTRARRFQVGPRTFYGRAVRIRMLAGNQAALKAVRAKPDRERIWLNDGSTGGKWGDPADRDWA
jgi:hypothetical protein